MGQRRNGRVARQFDRLEKQRQRLLKHEAMPREDDGRVVRTGRISPRNQAQRDLVEAIDDNRLTFALGTFGTGKTYLAAGKAVQALAEERVSKIILTRPLVQVDECEGGDRMGFLPGDKEQKLHPYLIPLLEELRNFLRDSDLRRLRDGEFPVIEVAPLAYIRGRTLKDAFVILDEAQNATRHEIWTLITRMGENSTYVINGDPSQSDLPAPKRGGLEYYARLWDGVPGVETITFGANEIVRDPFLKTLLDRHPC